MDRLFLGELLRVGDVQRAVAADKLTDAALRQQYRAGLANYTTVQVDHILVKTKAEAQDVYAQVTAPGATEQDFLDLAKKISIDPSVKQNSGSLGSAVASTYTPPFADAVMQMQPGEISQPVHSSFGWHVILMNTKDVQPYKSVKQQLIDSGSSTIFNSWLHDQITNGIVVINPKYGRFDKDSLSVMHVSSTETETSTPSAGIPPPGASASPSASPSA